MGISSILGLLDSLIGIGTFIVVLILYFRVNYQYRRYVKYREQVLGDRPWALAIGINGDITGQVRPYLDENDMASVQIEKYVVEGFLKPDEYYNVLRDLSKIKGLLTAAGVTEVLVFYKGPVSLAMGIGSIFDNWVPVKVYEYSGGTYHQNFVLDKETVIGLLKPGPGGSAEDVFKAS